MKKLLAALIAATLTLTVSLFGCSQPTDTGNTGGGGNTDQPAVEKPEPVSQVVSVTIVYDGTPVTGGLVSLDITEANVTLSADVKTKGDPDYTVVWESSAPSVAEITQNGEVTLKSEGETVISATAGGKEHQIVLSVGNSFSTPQSYTVTVVGGTSSATSAQAGRQVTLIPAVEQYAADHLSFVKWEYLNADTMEPLTDLWLNGNIFRMPSANVLVRAVLDDMLYTLNVVDGTVKTAVNDGEAVEDLHLTAVGDTNTYLLPYDTQVTVQAKEEEAGEMFVGWDYAQLNNRRGEPGQKEYTFSMPDETLSLFAGFSSTRPLRFNDHGLSSPLGNQRIELGSVGGVPDPDLKGMNGFQYSIAANTQATAEGYTEEKMTGVNEFSTLRHGSQTVRMLIKNHSEQYTLKLEMYATMYSTVATSGVVTVGPGEIVETKWVATAGFHNPSFNLSLREAIGGSSSEAVTFDLVYEVADTFPSGDPQFRVPEAQYVQLQQRTTGADYPANSGIRGDCWASGSANSGIDASLNPTGVKFGGRKNVNNQTGITALTTRTEYMSWDTGAPFITAKISNLPAYDPANPQITIYFRVVNTNAISGTYNFGVGYAEDPTNDSTRVSTPEFVLAGNQTMLFGVTITRTSDAPLYITLIMPVDDSIDSGVGGRYDFNLVIQMMYNNQISVPAENIYGAVKEAV